MTTLLELPARVRQAEALLPCQAAAFQAGSTTAEAFRGQRVPQGLYEQRRSGTYMLRVRLPGGLATADQLAGLAALAAHHGCGRLHLTTRQDLQFHDLPLAAAVAIQQGLAAIGLSARGTGGNTVRNVACDPLAGVAGDEILDVRPLALATTALLLGRDGTDALPRKFKVVFSGSPADRAGAGIADLGFVATRRDGVAGLQVVAGGGLGGKPAVSVPIMDLAPVADVPLIAVALVNLFAQHGDRSNKAIARLRHVRHRLGAAAFADLCRAAISEQRARGPLSGVPEALPLPTVRGLGTPGPLPAHLASLAGIVAEQESGRFSVRLAPALGDLSHHALSAIAAAARQHADPVLRAGLDQELWLTGVAGPTVPDLLAALAAHPVGAPDALASVIPACAGADTCKLGLLRSRPCATAVGERLRREGLALDGLRISGCPNSCGRHLVARIGLEGRVRRVQGRMLPCFEVLSGGRHDVGGATLGARLGTVPAKRIPDLMAAAARGGDLPSLVAEHAKLPEAIPEDWFNDWGDTRPFSLAGLGEGECAAGA